MAKIKWSGIGIVDGRGKINGTVLSKNRGGAYARVKVTPNNPRSAAQMFVRSNLTFLAKKWGLLQQSERESWNAAVSNYTKTDVFGDVKTPTGYNLYMRINTALRDASTQLFFNIPAPAIDVVGVAEVLPSQDNTTKEVLLGVNFAPDSQGNGYLLIDASPPLSEGVSTAGTKYKRLMTHEVQDFSVNVAAVAGIDDAYRDIYGDPEANKKIFFRVTPMMSNGQRGIPTIGILTA